MRIWCEETRGPLRFPRYDSFISVVDVALKSLVGIKNLLPTLWHTVAYPGKMYLKVPQIIHSWLYGSVCSMCYYTRMSAGGSVVLGKAMYSTWLRPFNLIQKTEK